MNIAKFLPPKTANVLDRERLMQSLLSWEDKRLVIVHAQAGQGKSTLAAGYVQSLATPAAWYNIDQDDDNPVVFLTLLSQAIQRAWPDRLPKLPLAPLNQYSAGGVHQSLDRWTGQVFGNLPAASLIVFDDYVATPSGSLQHVLNKLIALAPPQVRFLIISRTQPELGTAKLRAMQAVGELSGEDLRFSDAEVQDLFGIVFGMQLSQNEAALINGTAEGWPAGLVLMHEYLSSLPPNARALALTDRRATGFRTHVFDYLAQEVFVHLPQAMQRFLVRTSIVDYLTAPLIGLLTGLPENAPGGKPSIAAMVKELRNRNLFVSASGDDAAVIRYHSLFRDFLRKKLIAQTRPTDVKKLYSLASAHFRRSGDPVRSADLLIASGQFNPAVRQIEACGGELIARGQTGTLIRWIEALPLEYGNRPWLLFYRAVACRFTDPRTALTFFELALKGFRSRPATIDRTSGLIHSLCGVIEACFHTGGDFSRMARAAAMANKLLARGRRVSPGARAKLLLAMGMAWFFIGRLQQGSTALRQALDLFRKQGDRFYQMTSAIYLTPCALYQGDFGLARLAVREGFEAQESIQDETGGRAALFLVAAMSSLFEGDLPGAQERIDQCRNLADVHSLESMVFLSLDIGGWLKIAQGDYSGAELLLAECKRRAEESRNAFFSASAAHLLAIAFLFQGKLDRAKSESDYALAIRTQSGSTLFHAIYLIASGAIHLRLKRHRRAETELRTALRMLRENKAAQQEANAHLMLARLYFSMKKTDLARRHLEEGFSIGRERGFTYYALFNAAELAELAGEALSHGICADYCDALLSGRAGGKASPLLKVQCLGGFKIYRGATPVPDGQWKSRRARTLLKLLAAQAGRDISREQALEMLWPGSHPDRLRPAFNSLLHRARKVLEPRTGAGKDIFCARQEGDLIGLNNDLVWTDVKQFLAHLDEAERIGRGGQPGNAMEEYGKAVALYRGDFLPEDPFLEWASPVRDSLRARYLRALEDGAKLAESAGDRDRALAFQEKLFSADACNEKACCWLMTRYLSDKQRGKAVRTYEQCERALSRDLDLEPGEQTKRLFRSIIGG
jgi:ATP/maltotriose-dependent transcriptional regulator MalT/DNA-binding SARP family transcriptional activator